MKAHWNMISFNDGGLLFFFNDGDFLIFLNDGCLWLGF